MMSRNTDTGQEHAERVVKPSYSAAVLPFAPPGPRPGSAAAWRAFAAAVHRWVAAAEVEQAAARTAAALNDELIEAAQIVGCAR